ncbi:ABC-2 type transport system permease protein [Luteibacter sp. Sphag1AF]|uniref:ABC-2 transporter permease n=1 Tax=Luteibacter sp. Sphag1AF TaxID=2587031 RepID=UPI00160E668E|nr:ABC-2 transporter permease [Luteibacter sp. Sphag1AF]MBB3228888.1 ABC-2 type transport system permease protein [Luteibacter sp. Sphag1AF]
MKTFYWLVKREYWENRGGFFRAPLITAIVFLVLNFMAIVLGEVLGRSRGLHFNTASDAMGSSLSNPLGNLDNKDLSQVGAVLDMTLYGFTTFIVCVTAIVVFFYCLGALYDDRRDRSFLFWKSLPISDTNTVLSKVASAAILAPVISVVIGVVGGLILLLMGVIAALFHGINVWQVLLEAHPLRVAFNMVCLIPLYALWALPTIGWLMLCSAWARSKPFLWAIALPLGSAVVVQWFGLMGLFNLPAAWFWTNVPGRLLMSLIPGGWLRDTSSIGNVDKHDISGALDSVGLSFHYSVLGSPNIWIGAAVGAVMIGAAIWFRRWREEA